MKKIWFRKTSFLSYHLQATTVRVGRVFTNLNFSIRWRNLKRQDLFRIGWLT